MHIRGWQDFATGVLFVAIGLGALWIGADYAMGTAQRPGTGVLPRILAIIIGLPMLTFLSAMAALFGAGLVAWMYGGITPEVYLQRLQQALSMSTFMVGMIKAPFMALVIGLIASLEGLAVRGSAESLGRQVTNSVVKAIFMVIVVDGLFAMFFAAINY